MGHDTSYSSCIEQVKVPCLAKWDLPTPVARP